MPPANPHPPALVLIPPQADDEGSTVGLQGSQMPRDLEAVYRQHAPIVSRWAQRLAGPGADLDDIVHDVFLVVQRRLKEFRGESQLSTWLFEITVRVVQSHRRRRGRWWWPFNAEDEASHQLVEPASGSPLEDLERREVTALLYRFLDDLDEKYRTAVILFELQGLSCQEIARITKTSLPNVWARVSRGREQLVQAFADWTTGKKR